MPVMTAEQIADCVLAYNAANLKKGKWVNRSRKYQRCPAYAEFSARRESGEASPTFTWDVKTSQYSNREYDSLYGKDSLNRENVMGKATSRYAMQKTHYLLDRREPAMLSGDENRIYNYIDVQKANMKDAYIEDNEEDLWRATVGPNDGTAGDIQVFGIPHVLTTTNATSTFGFNGGEASGYSLTFGLEKDANENLRNGNGLFSSWDELEVMLNDAMDLSYFEPPYKGSAALGEITPEMDYVLWSTRKWWTQYQLALNGSNDDLGKDLGKYRGNLSKVGGVMQYRGVPWSWIPAISKVGGAVRLLTEDVFGLDLSTWKTLYQGDMWEIPTELTAVDDAHNVFKQFEDTISQTVCTDFQANFRLSQATASAA
jgi:hypothetical protein